jgi:hypothetical protein
MAGVVKSALVGDRQCRQDASSPSPVVQAMRADVLLLPAASARPTAEEAYTFGGKLMWSRRVCNVVARQRCGVACCGRHACTLNVLCSLWRPKKAGAQHTVGVSVADTHARAVW